MTEKQTGGPAFPMVDPFVVKCPKNEAEAQRLAEGMTLRDYFAAKAMQGELASQHPETGEYNNLDALAVLSYRVADAMLKARDA